MRIVTAGPGQRRGDECSRVVRDLVFVSHANPADNEYTRWLVGQLTLNGYRVWSDVTKLIAGETFWREIEDAIRSYAIKLVFVFSRASNTTDGVLNELAVAASVAKSEGIKDFILPVKIDDIPFSDANVFIHRLNVVDSSTDWAAGLRRILDKLGEDRVPQPLRETGAETVANWWRGVFNAEAFYTGPETTVSNWYALALPSELRIHSIDRSKSIRDIGRLVPYPFHRIRGLLVTFASLEGSELDIHNTISVDVSNIFDGSTVGPLDTAQLRNSVVYILSRAFVSAARSTGLGQYELSNKRYCAFYKPELSEKKRLPLSLAGMPKTSRALAGKWQGATWHFGISAYPSLEPFPHMEVSSHVLFSDDGRQIWNSSNRLHRARRSMCRHWWNAEWRDRNAALLLFLAGARGGDDHIDLPVGETAKAVMTIESVAVSIPRGYDESKVTTMKITFGDDYGE